MSITFTTPDELIQAAYIICGINQAVKDAEENGHGDVYAELEASGRFVDITGNTPFYTDGWKPRRLAVGEILVFVSDDITYGVVKPTHDWVEAYAVPLHMLEALTSSV